MPISARDLRNLRSRDQKIWEIDIWGVPSQETFSPIASGFGRRRQCFVTDKWTDISDGRVA